MAKHKLCITFTLADDGSEGWEEDGNDWGCESPEDAAMVVQNEIVRLIQHMPGGRVLEVESK